MAGRHQHVLLREARHLDPAGTWADELYQRAAGGAWWRWLGFVTSRGQEQLLHLGDVLRDRPVAATYDAGLREVPLAQIRGSESRSRRADFDGAFRPLRPYLKERWIRVARAWYEGVVLPPVMLIQVDDRYFVRDGHHRISVARAVGQESIWAQVTVREGGRFHLHPG